MISNFRFTALKQLGGKVKKVLGTDVGQLLKRNRKGLIGKGSGVTTSAQQVKDKLAKKAASRVQAGRMKAGEAIAKQAKSGRNPFLSAEEIAKKYR